MVGSVGVPTYQPGMFEIVEAIDAELIRLRIGSVSTGIGAILGSVIGDPNGQERGWPGDIRFQIDNPTIWQKIFGEGDEFGWVELEASGFAGAITALQLQVAQLTADLAALGAQVGANTAAIAVLQMQLAALTLDVATLQTQIQSSFITAVNEPSLPGHRRINPTGALSGTNNAPGTTFDLFVSANGIDNSMLATMPANTIKSNPTGAVGNAQDFAVGTDSIVGRVAGNLVAAPAVTSQIGDDQITNAKLANMAALSVKVNATALADNPQDIAATADNQALMRISGALVWSGILQEQITDLQDGRTVFEVTDFSVGQPNGEVASGALDLVDTLRGITLSWDAQRAGATSYAIGVNGLRYVADATSTSFSSTTFTASYIRLLLGELYTEIPTVDASCTLTIEAYFDLLTMTSNLPGVAAVGWGLNAVPSNSAARMRGAGRGLRSGVQTAFGKTDGAEGTNYTNAPANTGNVLVSVLSPDNGCAAIVGARASLAAGWPQYRNVVAAPAGPSANPTTMLDENSYLAIGMWTGGVAGNMITQLRSLRIRAWR